VALSQLAVFAPAAVETARISLLVTRFLAVNTRAHTSDGLAASLGDSLAAFLAFFQALTTGQLAASALNRVLDTGVYLILHCPVFGPTTGHKHLPRT
jgi:hypothetical protein